MLLEASGSDSRYGANLRGDNERTFLCPNRTISCCQAKTVERPVGKVAERLSKGVIDGLGRR